MAFIPKRKYASKRYAKKSAIKRMASGPSSQIKTLAKAVRTLQKKDKTDAQYLNFTQQVFEQNVQSPVYTVNLSDYSGMISTFGTSANDNVDNRIIHKSVGMDCRVTLENAINNEESTIGFTAFLVSLKDAVGNVYNNLTGGLTLTLGATHEMIQGMVLLNKQIFNVHKIKRFTLTNYNQALISPAAQSQYGTDHRWYWRLPINKTIVNPRGDWKQLGCALDPSKQYYLMIFNDNSTSDLESPAFSFVNVHTFKTLG
nr:coat protein [Lake Sarah-associated circular virus-37]